MKRKKLFKTLLLTAIMGLCLVSVTSCNDDKDKEKTEQTTKYTITFNSQGGGTVTKIENIVSGAKATKPTDPKKDGYDFKGWFTDSACSASKEFKFDTNTVTANITLYAKWEPTEATKLATAKTTAKTALDTHVTSLKANAVTYETAKDALAAEVTKGKAAIDAATTNALIDSALEEAKKATSAIKSDQDIKALKTDNNALDELTQYVLDNYKDLAKSILTVPGGTPLTDAELKDGVKTYIADAAQNKLTNLKAIADTDLAEILETFNALKAELDSYLIGIAIENAEEELGKIYVELTDSTIKDNHPLVDSCGAANEYLSLKLYNSKNIDEVNSILEAAKAEFEFFVDPNDLMIAKLNAKYEFIIYAFSLMEGLNDEEEVDIEVYMDFLESSAVYEVNQMELLTSFVTKVDELSKNIFMKTDAESLESAKNTAIEEFKPLFIIILIDFTNSALEVYYKAEIAKLELTATKTTEAITALKEEIKVSLEDFGKARNFTDFHGNFATVKQKVDTFITNLGSTESGETN